MKGIDVQEIKKVIDERVSKLEKRVEELENRVNELEE
jgi:ubiquinone biosynthesis protein UbiJ